MPRPSTLSLLLRLAGHALALGLVFGGALGWIEMQRYLLLRDVRWPLLASGIELGVAVAAAAIALWVLVFWAARRRWSARAAARTATVVAGAGPFLGFARELNRQLLPGFLEPASLIPNALLCCAGLALGELLSRRLPAALEGPARWHGALGLATVLTAAVVGVHALGHAGRSDRGPDVLFVLIDVARADHLGCYGYARPTSPNLDRLAADSVLFENAISSSTFTKTSIASLFTGLNAHHHGVYLGTFGADPTKVESDTLSGRFTTLAEALHDAGLNTVAWVQNGQLRGFMGYDQGFSLYHDQAGLVDRIGTGFLDWYATWAERTPYFAYLHLIDLHAPYHPPPPYQGRFGSQKGDLSERMSDASWYDFKVDVATGKVQLSPEDLAGFEARYDELIARVDDWIGRLVQELKDSGRYDDTLIVVTSDHGEGFWEHGFISHSNLPFDELVHVPLIVKMPRSQGAGRRVDRMVGTIDLMPTLLDLVGAHSPSELEGRSFLPLLTEAGPDLEPGWLMLEFRGILGVRTERWKLIQLPGQEPELYDLHADPEEQIDCIEAHPDVAERLGAAVERSREIRARAQAAERVVLDDETVRSLEALGYL